MLLVLVVLCLMLTGCGAVGDPLPPLLDIPQPPAAFTAAQRGDKVILTWPTPLLTTENVKPRPDRLGPIEIYRFVLGDLDSKPPIRDSKEFHESLTYQKAKPIRSVPAGATEAEDPIDPAWMNHIVVYAVKMTNHNGKSADFSNLVPVAMLKVGPPPTFDTKVTEHAIELRWNGAAGESFRVFRDGAPLGDVTGSSYDDRDFEFDHPYTYMIRALAHNGKFTSESSDSAMHRVTPRDVYPPVPPHAVRAVAIEGSAEISWTPNDEPDLAGYNVYKAGKKLNDKLVTNTVFRDTAPGAAPRYTVTAVDTHGNESQLHRRFVLEVPSFFH